MFRLSDGEEIMMLAFFRFDTIPECDGQTDIQNERRTDIPPLAIPAVCTACYANTLVKSVRSEHPSNTSTSARVT